MNRKKKIIEGYWLLFSDLLCIVIAYGAAILLRYGKFARVQEPEVHALMCVFFLLFCTMYSFLLDWNRSFLERGIFVEFVAVFKFNLFMVVAAAGALFMIQRGAAFSRLVWGYFAVFNMLLVWLVRLFMKRLLRVYLTSESNLVKIMVITRDSVMNQTVSQLKEKLDLNYEIVALACVDEDRKGVVVDGVKVSAGGGDVLTMARQMALDEAFVNLPDMDKKYVKKII